MRTTYMAKPTEVDRKWYVVDAAGKPLGRVASQVAAVLTGKKLDQKLFRRHSRYPGGLRSTKYKDLMAQRPVLAMETAIKGMLPHNRLGRRMFTKLFVYAGADHKHQAQKPEVLEIIG